jgi:hypothetical protein
VHDLPAELLLIIFKLAEPSTGWIFEDINNPSLFPYSIAAVCSRWRDVMSLIPEFWTRIVIVVDLYPATAPAVLSWSRNLPLDITVTRVDFDQPVDVQHEQDQVVSVMKALVHSHVHRSRTLHFNVKFSSSLPPFPDSFPGDWSKLSQLFFQCQEDNGGSTDIWGSVTSTEQLEYPALKWLLIDGRNYYNACRKDSQWTVRCPSVSDLIISKYTPLPDESFTLTNLMLPIITLPSLENLWINDISLHPSPATLAATVPLDHSVEIQLSDIHDFKPIADVLDLLRNNLDITLTCCAMGHPRRPFNREGCLTLRYIEAYEDLVPLLRCWQGERLYVDDCPAFNDVVLNMMATVEAGEYVCSPRMHQLNVADCPNFSAAALRRFVSTRFVVDGRAFSVLYISGLAPDLSTEDQQHISQHVHDFDYDPSQS